MSDKLVREVLAIVLARVEESKSPRHIAKPSQLFSTTNTLGLFVFSTGVTGHSRYDAQRWACVRPCAREPDARNLMQAVNQVYKRMLGVHSMPLISLRPHVGINLA